MTVPLPTPDGPVMTNTEDGSREPQDGRLRPITHGLRTTERVDQFAALALGETDDGLARRDAATLENLRDLYSAVTRHGKHDVGDLGRVHALRRV